MLATRTSLRLALILLSCAFLLTACSDAVNPSKKSTLGAAGYTAQLDPSAAWFELAQVQKNFPGQVSVTVTLLGSNLQLLDDGRTVMLDVALRNDESRPIYPPAIVWVSRFDPPSVIITNADVLHDSIMSAPEIMKWGMDYSGLLGSDEMLDAEEISEAKTWVFDDLGFAPFSFMAEAFFSLEPDIAFIAGELFEDLNYNGLHDADEGPFMGGVMELRKPDGTRLTAMPANDSSFRFPVQDAGLYQLRFESIIDCPVCETTLNPIQVLLTSTPSGAPRSFTGARFGAVCGECPDRLEL